ncbi:MAG: zinc-ribbon domain-containing protein [Paracoccaceae bacterium]
MRLICPSCAAEYEIDALAIGEKGRTVRCASCAAEWFQQPERASVSDAAAAVEAAAKRSRPTVIAPEPRREVAPPASPAIEGDPAEEIHFDDAPRHYTAAEPEPRGRVAYEPDALTAALRDDDDDDDERSGGAFLAGFATVTLIVLILLAAYVKAAEIGDLAPALKAPLAAYTGLVDQGRAALAGLADVVMARL